MPATPKPKVAAAGEANTVSEPSRGEFADLRNVHGPAYAKPDQLLTITNRLSALRELFVHDLDLLVEHLAGEPVDRHMYPIVLFAFHDKLRKISGLWILG